MKGGAMKIIVKRVDEKFLEEKRVLSWPIWEKEESEFDWFYDSEEHCYLLEGKVTVFVGDEKVTFGAGDYVIFPKGLKCRWRIEKKVRKHYNFY